MPGGDQRFGTFPPEGCEWVVPGSNACANAGDLGRGCARSGARHVSRSRGFPRQGRGRPQARPQTMALRFRRPRCNAGVGARSEAIARSVDEGQVVVRVATMATFDVRSRSSPLGARGKSGSTMRIRRTLANRSEHCSESTSWGSLVRAQYRPSLQSPATCGLRPLSGRRMPRR